MAEPKDTGNTGHALTTSLKFYIEQHGLSKVLNTIAEACEIKASEYLAAGHIEENNAVKWFAAAEDTGQLARDLKEDHKL